LSLPSLPFHAPLRAAKPPRQIRQAVSEYAILPIGAAALHERLPYTRTLLLAGAPKTGKTLLTNVRAHLLLCNCWGARWLPFSCHATR
jgi:hypothetical protein